MDIPMSRVKFNVNSEWAYIQNFKILQSESDPGENPAARFDAGSLPVAMPISQRAHVV